MPAYDVAVIGAGVFGSWTAWHLRRANKRVLLVDAWGPGHSRSSSGGESRIIRMGYGPDAIYTRMAQRSLIQWQDLFERTGKPLFHRTGVLWIGSEDDPYTSATRQTFTQESVPMEVIPASELAQRYPQMRISNQSAVGILEPESGALMARQAVAAVAEDAIAMGVDYTRALVDPAHQEIQVDAFVYACGPWLPKLFPELLGKRIYPTRQEVFFFAAPPMNIPVWIDFTDPRGPYGFPDLENRGVKLAFDYHGDAFDPDSGDRNVSSESVARAREFMGERFPALRDAPLTETRVCQYENTSNGDFLIDRHPDFENVWLVGGGSGHGFKHGPAVGEYTTSQILNSAPAEPRFSLATKHETQNRCVY